MQNLPLTYYERVNLGNICGGHQVASLKEADVYLRLIGKLRPTDAEKRETQFSALPEGGLRWNLPAENYGNKVIPLEDDEARALKAALEAVPGPVRVSDAEWMLRLTEMIGMEETQPA